MPTDRQAINSEIANLLIGHRIDGYLLEPETVTAIFTQLSHLVQAPPAARPPIRGWVGATAPAEFRAFLLECGFNVVAGPPTAMRWADDEPDGDALYREVVEWASEHGIVFIPQKTAGPQDGDRIIPGRVVETLSNDECWSDTGLPCPYHERWASMMYHAEYLRSFRTAPWCFRDWEQYVSEGQDESDVRFRPHLGELGNWGCDYRNRTHIRTAIRESDIEAEVLFQAAPNASPLTPDQNFSGHLQRMVIKSLLAEGRRAIVADTRAYWAWGARLRDIRGMVLEQAAALAPGAEYTLVANLTEEHQVKPWKGADPEERRERAIDSGKWLWHKGVRLFDGAWVYALGAGDTFTDSQLDAIKRVATSV